MLVSQIKKYSSVSIVGMAKNTGKTTCLNYILSKLNEEKYKVAVTSIGVDGEEKDVLYGTPKPRITIHSGNIFITSEKHFNEKKLDAKIIYTSNQNTPLGRLITAEALSTGQIILSGPSTSELLAEYIDKLKELNVALTLVDGALHRMSLASPSVTDALVLCTGAAYSTNLNQLIKNVKYKCELINIKKANNITLNDNIMRGVWLIDENGIKKLSDSLFTSDIKFEDNGYKNKYIYIAGALTDNFLKELNKARKLDGLSIIVRDFSRIFVASQNYYKFVRKGGRIIVKESANLIAICSNPTSPDGYNYEPEELRYAIETELNLPVYDIMKS